MILVKYVCTNAYHNKVNIATFLEKLGHKFHDLNDSLVKVYFQATEAVIWKKQSEHQLFCSCLNSLS